MSSLNKAILIGRVGKDPELRRMQNGDAIASLSLATSETWKDKATGEKREATEWHRVVFYGRQAEVVAEYGKKGAMIYVEGQLKTRKWTDKDGVERYTTEVQGRELKLLARPNDGSQGQQRAAAPAAQQQAAPAARSGGAPASMGADMDDDIPFAFADFSAPQAGLSLKRRVMRCRF